MKKESKFKQRMKLTPYYYKGERTTFDDIKTAAMKNKKMFNEVAKMEKIPVPVFYFEYLISAILCLNTPSDFIAGEQYKNSLFKKFKQGSEFKWFILDQLFNRKVNIEDEKELVIKKEFIKKYQAFIGRESICAEESDDNSIRNFIQKNHSVICKPINGSCGNGIFFLSENEMTSEIIYKLQKEKYIIEQVIKQHPEMAELNPTSVNTLRLITAIDKTGTPHVVVASLRIGKKDSVVDNCSSGGTAFAVDIDTGVINNKGINYSTHRNVSYNPLGTKLMIGFKIPNYDKAIELVKQAALVAPSLRWVGWDVAITEDGAVLIEGNSNYPAGPPDKCYFVDFCKYL